MALTWKRGLPFQHGGPILEGAAAGRPAAASAPDTIYFASDTGVASYSDGASWTAIAYSVLSASDVPDMSATYQVRSERGANSGYATLDSGGDVPAGQLDNAVVSLAKSGSTALHGAVTLSAGSGVTLTQAGNDVSIASSAGGGGLFTSYALIRDEKAANTAGGGFTSGAWRTRDLNTESFDPDGIVSISANQFTLQTGTDFVKARAPAFGVGRHKAKLANITDVADTLIGSSEFAIANGSGGPSFVTGRFTIVGAKVFEIQHQCQTTKATNGFGVESNFAVVEVYTEVEIWME